MSEVRCSSLENVYIRVPKYFVHWPLTLKTSYDVIIRSNSGISCVFTCLGNSQIHGFTAAVHVHLYALARLTLLGALLYSIGSQQYLLLSA
jgi:hypothetical protein